jgi:ABC-type phosphate transport system permease subunit
MEIISKYILGAYILAGLIALACIIVPMLLARINAHLKALEILQAQADLANATAKAQVVLLRQLLKAYGHEPEA